MDDAKGSHTAVPTAARRLKRRNYTTQERQQALRAYKGGMGIKEVAENSGIQLSSIYKWTRKLRSGDSGGRPRRAPARVAAPPKPDPSETEILLRSELAIVATEYDALKAAYDALKAAFKQQARELAGAQRTRSR